MFEIGMSALVLKICSEYAKALGLNFPPCVQQEINAIAQYVDLHTVKDLKVEQDGSVVTITCFTEGEQEKVFTVTLPEVNVDTLSALLKGSSSVVVDKSEDGRTLVVRLDKSQEVQYVELTPASAAKGNLTDTQWNILQANKGNCIILNNEIYRLADNQNVNGLITYVHTGWDGTARKDKSISITVSTKAWTLVADSGGGKLYKHDIGFTVNISETETKYAYFTLYSTSHENYTFYSLLSLFDKFNNNCANGTVVHYSKLVSTHYALYEIEAVNLESIKRITFKGYNDGASTQKLDVQVDNTTTLTDTVTEL